MVKNNTFGETRSRLFILFRCSHPPEAAVCTLIFHFLLLFFFAVQADTALHAVFVPLAHTAAPAACPEGREGPATQKRDHRPAQSPGGIIRLSESRGSDEYHGTWIHPTARPTPLQEERTQTGQQGMEQRLECYRKFSSHWHAAVMLPMVVWAAVVYASYTTAVCPWLQFLSVCRYIYCCGTSTEHVIYRCYYLYVKQMSFLHQRLFFSWSVNKMKKKTACHVTEKKESPWWKTSRHADGEELIHKCKIDVSLEVFLRSLLMCSFPSSVLYITQCEKKSMCV